LLSNPIHNRSSLTAPNSPKQISLFCSLHHVKELGPDCLRTDGPAARKTRYFPIGSAKVQL
ncbi:hypothetical protein, partial [Dyadobacter sediminis]|uniref:hypothetical protein n=1 Tax=Dyadobacter sediminis TaxID=1493691 RepID=UPI001BB1047E